MSLRNMCVAVCCVSAVIAATAYGVMTTRTVDPAGLAMTELQVENMTCGSCVAKITAGLKSLSGVQSVDVSVTTGTSKITFDPQLIDAEKLAAKVTSIGFPAKVGQLLSSEQYHSLQSEESKLSADYVARIGEKLVSRTHFNQEIEKYFISTGQQDSPEARVRVIGSVWQTVVQRTLLLQAAAGNQVIVQNGEVDLRIQRMQQGMPKMDDFIRSRYGTAKKFRQQLKEDMVINRNIEQNVIAQIKDGRQRQENYNKWFQGLVDNTSIIIYDQQLKQTASSAGGCGSGGGCCG